MSGAFVAPILEDVLGENVGFHEDNLCAWILDAMPGAFVALSSQLEFIL